MKRLVFGGLAVLLVSLPQTVVAHMNEKQEAIVNAEIRAFSHLLSHQPKTAIDFSEVSGAYCFDAGLGQGANMTHFAIDPTKSSEDVIDFVGAQSMVDAGLDVGKLPEFPGELGSMAPNQWYYLPAGAHEPHHGMSFGIPLLMRASNIQ